MFDDLKAAGRVTEVAILANAVDAISYASHQNAYRTLYALRVRHDGSEPLEDLDLVFTSEPPLCRPKTWRIDRLHPNATLEIPSAERAVALDGDALRGLTEAVRGEMVFRLQAKDGAVLAEARLPVRFLTRAEWGGFSSQPELLAAFSLPNAPAVQEILKSAAEAMSASGLSGSLNGYLSKDRARAWEIGSAIWSAVAGRGLSYAVPPASFERVGQKVRLPEQVLGDGLATCLDSTMLFASCLEQAGLDPAVVLTEGHAFCAFWLRPSEMLHVLSENGERLRAEVKLGNLVAFETTMITHTPAPSFSEAIAAGEKQLALDAVKPLHAFIDIRRARLNNVGPIDVERRRYGGRRGAAPAAPDRIEPAPALPPKPILVDPAALKTRLESWRRKLLDLSKRNRLLNFKAGDAAAPFVTPDPDAALAMIAGRERIEVSALPNWSAAQGEPATELQAAQGFTPEAHAAELLRRGELLADLKQTDLDKRLQTLLRRQRAAFQETGANVLYLALGLMRWRESAGGPALQAPLILAPMRLSRQGARGKIRLARAEGEIRFNATLLELMRQEIGVEIPNAEALVAAGGPDMVANVLRAVTEAVREVDGWEVEDAAWLSVFSFAKYLMWRDLTDLEDRVAQNRLVRHLIESPRDPYPHAKPLVDPAMLDAALPPARDHTVLPADASQLAAVHAASRNQDFVLMGPPGTGKSQTIVNLIAQSMAEGRSVLFVSAKTAALDVVQRRLKAVGLGDACLEIHSAKADRDAVLAQLRRALEARPGFGEAAGAKLDRDLARLTELRAEQGALIAALHGRHPCGLTAYEAFGAGVASRGAREVWRAERAHDAAELEEMRRTLARIDAAVARLGGVAEHPLRLIGARGWSEAWAREVDAALAALDQALEAAAPAAAAFAAELGARGAAGDLDGLEALGLVAEALSDPGEAWLRLARRPSAEIDAALGRVRDAEARMERLSWRADALAGAYRTSAWTRLDVGRLERVWTAAATAGWARRAWLQGRVRAALEAHAKGPVDPDRDLPRLLELWRARRALLGDAAVRGLIGEDWALDPAALGRLAADLATAARFKEGLRRLEARAPGLARRVEAALARRRGVLRGGPKDAGLVAAMRREAAALAGARARLERLAEAELAALTGARVPDLRAALQHARSARAELRTWCAWRALRETALAQDLAPVIEEIERGAVAPGGASALFETAFKLWWATHEADQDETLKAFAPTSARVAAAEIAALGADIRAARRAEIRDGCLARRPETGELGVDGEMRVLVSELERKKGGLPLRQLLAGVPTLLPRLTPCVLMSPMSVAQHLDVAKTIFDVVIFDEASQISTWDAVGAIARGRQTIVVGDPKQLPPTSFFDRQDVAADADADPDEDMESILDECVAAQLPVLQLSWHYRSRDESLIAFSNRLYYANSLTTFPSPRLERRVRLERVPGRYLRGGARTNPVEARALVDALVARLRAELSAERPKTFGVVTFNAEQQRLIEDLFDAALRAEPGLERFAAEDAPEPVVVKNLESIQGDERDVILFSTTFGPDEPGGPTPMNFGPLNRQGGERRLNVAVTRAREELVVFSSFSAADVDLSRSDARGVADLRRFLDYAERGPDALPAFGADADGPAGAGDAFADAVALALRARGYEVDRDVGLSGARIDVAVRDPEDPARHLAAIECDGRSWADGRTAQDREASRGAMLEGLGWRRRREHVLEWRRDPDGALRALEAHLRAPEGPRRAPRADHVAPGLRMVWSGAR